MTGRRACQLGLILGLLVGLLSLAACVTQPTRAPGSWSDRQTLIQGMQDWHVRGRVALKVAEEGGNGRLSWQQHGDEIELTFRGPFGAGGFRISGTVAKLTLTTKEGDTYLSDDPRGDLRHEVGWSVPIHSLGYWMRGIPDPQSPVETLDVDDEGLLRRLHQDGWEMTYERYRVFEDRNLPRKLKLQGENVRLKVAVDHWQWDVDPAD